MGKNIQISIVEDEKKQRTNLKNYVEKYLTGKGLNYEIHLFENGDDFIENYQPVDIVFLDIMMPGTNGMDIAKLLRNKDFGVQLIFVTNMAQFAVKGYEVKAFDFIVKPISYSEFEFKLSRVLESLNRAEAYITIRQPEEGIRISLNDLYYIEVQGHKLIYHINQGNIVLRGSMKDIEESMLSIGLLKCNNCYLINPKYVEWLKGYEVKVNEDILQISHPRKKQFYEDMASFYATGGVLI